MCYIQKSHVLRARIKWCSTGRVCLPTLLYVHIAVSRAIDKRQAPVTSHVYMVCGTIRARVKVSGADSYIIFNVAIAFIHYKSIVY